MNFLDQHHHHTAMKYESRKANEGTRIKDPEQISECNP
jgi:hypothetical protein